MTVAALFVAKGGCYWNLDGVDAWDEARDARLYAGPWPVVAHPPCARWCQLAHLVQARWGYVVGEDEGMFASALASTRKWGGVLEHPAESLAWPRYDLPRPPRSGWARDTSGGWSTEICQRNYGHRARKRTWLYYVGKNAPPPMKWEKPARSTAQVSNLTNRGGLLEWLPKKERAATPPAFRDLLLSIARSCAPTDKGEG